MSKEWGGVSSFPGLLFGDFSPLISLFHHPQVSEPMCVQGQEQAEGPFD